MLLIEFSLGVVTDVYRYSHLAEAGDPVHLSPIRTTNAGQGFSLDVMSAALDRLDANQRDQVEQASAVLRKARAGARLPLEDITRRKGTT
jgi:hypothetical protein